MATKKRLIDANKFKRNVKLEFLDRRDKFISMKDLFECIDDMDTVDAVEVVHGRWLTPEEYANQGYNGWLYCSECEQPMREFYGWDYCPNCGADMRERKDND